MRRFEFYRVREGTDLGDPNTLNSVFQDVDIRLASMEESKMTWDEQAAVLVELGLGRVNEFLLPAVQRVNELSNLGALFSAQSDTSALLAPGVVTLTINEAKRLAFAPSWYLSIVSESNPGRAMAGTLVSYDETTGALVVDVLHVMGEGDADDWRISPGSATEALDVLLRSEASALSASQSAAATAADRIFVNGARDQVVAASEAAIAARDVTTAARNVATAARDITTGARDATLAALASWPRWYLGAFAADPTSGPGGIPLEPGMLYANTGSSEMRAYFPGGGWTAVYVPADSTVASVFGRTGAVGAAAGDYNSGQISRTDGANGVAGNTVEAALAAIVAAMATASHSHANATTGAAGFMSAADKAKLDAVSPNATTNDTDANLKARANHTGEQPISTVTGLQAALDGKSGTGHTHAFADLTGKPTTLAGYGLTNAYTKSEVDAALNVKLNASALTAWIRDTFGIAANASEARAALGLGTAATTAATAYAAASHTHDDRYYTESEITTLLSGKQAASARLSTFAGLTGNNLGFYLDTTGALVSYSLTAAGRALLDDADPAAQRVTLGVLGSEATGQSFTGGMRAPAKAQSLTGTLALDPGNGNTLTGTNSGAFTIGALAQEGAIDLYVTNGATAGAVTFSGFVGGDTGDALSATDGHQFLVQLRRAGTINTYYIKALQ